MPRPRTPTVVLEMSGATKHDPARYADRANEPVPSGELGPPPEHLDAETKSIWAELATIAPPGVLSNADRWVVEMLCHLMWKLRSGIITTGETSNLLIALSRIGLTPADRSRVAVTKDGNKDGNDPFGKLLL